MSQKEIPKNLFKNIEVELFKLKIKAINAGRQKYLEAISPTEKKYYPKEFSK